MRLIVDADAIIKLNRAGILAEMLRFHECVVPSLVYEEVAGEENTYADATSIGELLRATATIAPVEIPFDPVVPLGLGEQGILSILEQFPNAIIVSDDRQFLNTIASLGLSCLAPAGVVVSMVQSRQIGLSRAYEALDLLRPVIRKQVYDAARALLDAERGQT